MSQLEQDFFRAFCKKNKVRSVQDYEHSVFGSTDGASTRADDEVGLRLQLDHAIAKSRAEIQYLQA